MNTGILLAIFVFAPIIGALLSYLIGRFHKTARDYFADLLVVAEFVGVVILFAAYDVSVPLSFEIPGFAGFGLHFIWDGFRSVYALVAAIMWMMTTIFSKEYFNETK